MNLDARLHDPSFLLEHDARLRALARRLVHDAAQADDVVQETWMQALRGAHRVESRIGGWLSGITRHVAFGKRREDRSRARRERDSEPPSPTPSTEELLAREAARRAVVDAVMQLAEPARAVVVLRFFDDLSSRQIAARLGVPVETVRTRLKRALEQLRRELDRRYGGDGRAWCTALAPILAVQNAAVGTLLLASAVAAFLVLGTLGVMTFMTPRATARDGATARLAAAAALSESSASPSEDNTQSAVAVAPAQERMPVISASDISGRVVDDAGRPVADAVVTLSHQIHRGKNWRADNDGTTTTQRDGTFKFPNVPTLVGATDTKRIDDLRAEHPGFVLGWKLAEPRSDVTIVLSRTVRLEGTIRDAVTHAPVEGATVAFCKYELWAVTTSATATTAADGRYAFDVPPNTRAIVAAQRSPSVPTVVAMGIGADPVTTLDIDLPPTRSVVVELRALTSRAPRPGLTIRASSRVLFADAARAVVGETDADGRCTLANVPVDGCACAVTDEASGVHVYFTIPPLSVVASGEPVQIFVPEGWTVRGRLLDPEGTPIAGATVGVDSKRLETDRDALVRRFGPDLGSVDLLQRIRFPTATTASDGSFEMVQPAICYGVTRITATRELGRIGTTVATLDDPQPASAHDVGTVALPKLGTLWIQVGFGGALVPRATILAEHASKRETWIVSNNVLTKTNLEPGTWTLSATAAGVGASELKTVEVVADTMVQVGLDLAADPDSFIVTSGIVLDEAGKPLAKASCFALQEYGPGGALPPNDGGTRSPRSRTLSYWIQADDAGRFEIKCPRASPEPLVFTFSESLGPTVGTALPGSTNVVIRKLATVSFHLHLVDAVGANLTAPVFLDWKAFDAFVAAPNAGGFSPSAAGMIEFPWPEGPRTLRIRRAHDEVDRAVIVDVDVRANDDATAPTIVVP